MSTLEKILENIPKYITTKKNIFYLSIGHLGRLPHWSVNYKSGSGDKLFEHYFFSEKLETALILAMSALIKRK